MNSPTKLILKNGYIKALAPAKINLFLEVTGNRSDGYHNIVTVMQAVNLYDELEIRPTKGTFDIICNSHKVPRDETNIIYKAVTTLQKLLNLKNSVVVKLKKRIPIGSGLGGGSSDASATILALNKLFALNLTLDYMSKIALEIGADIPFFLRNSSIALVKGKGEIVKPLNIYNKMYFVLVCPRKKNFTRNVYNNLNSNLTYRKKDVNLFLDTLRRKDIIEVGEVLFNRLETPAFKLNHQLKILKNKIKEFDFAGVLMTGSGSGIFGLCKNRKEAIGKKALLKRLNVGEVFSLTSI